jgi:hypothetical protein
MVAYMNHSRKQFNNHSGSSSTIVSFFVSEGLNLHIITHIYFLEPNAKNREIIKMQSIFKVKLLTSRQRELMTVRAIPTGSRSDQKIRMN